MVIMLVPLLLFFVGLFSIDQYRTTLIRSEFTALERQGFALARSLALAEAERDIGVVRRRLSPETMNHLLPLVGYGTKLHQVGLDRFGITPHHRKSFKPIRRYLSGSD